MLSRNNLTSNYGDFDRLMENRDEHGGFGNVTWNIGPHAKEQPYGEGYRVNFVDRNKLLAGVKPRSPEEVEQHINTIGQQMDRGDVIHLPYIKFNGSRPDIDEKHLAAIHAAGRRGAEKIPVVVNNDDHIALSMHAGGLQKVAAAGPNLDKNIKWRWNGRAWYSKPSFNQGRCPQGSKADLGNDACLGGGGAPPARDVPKVPSGLFGPDSLPSSRRKIKPRPAPSASAAEPAPASTPGRAAHSDRSLPPSIGNILDRSPLRGVTEPVGQGLARTVMHNRMDDALGNGAIEPGPYDSDGVKQMKAALRQAMESARQQDPSVNPGRFYGAGAAGAVFAGPEVDGKKTVYKFDNGPYEARMADAVMRAGLVGKVSSLPHYIKTIATDARGPSNLPIHVIHREDLNDAEKELPYREVNVLKYRGGLGGFVSDLSNRTKDDEELRRYRIDPRDRLKNRREVLDAFDSGIDLHRRRASAAGGQVAEQFDRIAKDIRTLIEHGMIPCDLHEGNWGIRPSTGEIVMRDVGCAHVLDK